MKCTDTNGNGLQERSPRKGNMGRNSLERKGATLDEKGVIEYLAYISVALVTTLFTGWNKHIMGRLKKNDETNDTQWSAIHKIELGLSDKFAEHEKQELERDAAHAAEITKEFKELRRDVNTGHTAILKEVNQLARQIRNGNNNGRT